MVCPVEVMQKEFPGKKVEEYRRMLGQFGVSGDMALQQVESLSGGQKSRVAFAVLCGHNPNFLVLGRLLLLLSLHSSFSMFLFHLQTSPPIISTLRR